MKTAVLLFSFVLCARGQTTVMGSRNADAGAAFDFSSAASYKVRIAAGLTTTGNGLIGYDSTGNYWHIGVNATDRIVMFRSTALPTNGNCVQWGALGIAGDAGAPCGVGGGSGGIPCSPVSVSGAVSINFTACSGINVTITGNVTALALTGGTSFLSITWINTGAFSISGLAGNLVGFSPIASGSGANTYQAIFYDGTTYTGVDATDNQGGEVPTLCTSATGNSTATCTIPEGITSYRDGQPLIFVNNFTNTTTYTVNVTPRGGSALGAKSILKQDGTALAAGDITTGLPKTLLYSATAGAFLIQGDGGSGGGGSGPYLVSTVTLSNSQALNLFTTPIQLVAAGGANTLIMPVDILMEFVGSTAFTCTGNLVLGYGPGLAASNSSSLAKVFMTSYAVNTVSSESSKDFWPLMNTFTNGTATTVVANLGLYIGYTTANCTGGAGSTVLISLGYRVVSGL